MYGPRVFLSMIGALVVFAIGTYALTGSIGSTALQTLICAVLLQVGYFAGVLYLVAKASREKASAASTSETVKKDADAKAAQVSSLKTPGHSNP